MILNKGVRGRDLPIKEKSQDFFHIKEKPQDFF
jgi:hypothetical protein